MGTDCSDIRLIVHVGPPSSIESKLQLVFDVVAVQVCLSVHIGPEYITPTHIVRMMLFFSWFACILYPAPLLHSNI